MSLDRTGNAYVARRTRTAALAVLLLVVLTGCFKMDVSLEVHSDETISGEFIVGVNESMAEMMGGEKAVAEMFSEGDTDLPDSARTEDWSGDGYIGQKIDFEAVPFAEMDDGDGFSLAREGDEFVFSSTVNEDLLSDDSDTAGGFLEGAEFPDPKFSFSVTFPGEVSEANGDVDGRTVTWDITRAKALGEEPLSARGSAIDSEPGVGALVVKALGGVLILAALVGLGLLGYRRFRGGATEDADGSDWAQTPHHQPPEETSPGAIPSGWYATADGAHERWHDGTGWTEHTRAVQ